MRTARLGCLTGTGMLAALITALAIVGFTFASGGQMFSPGALNDIHGDLVGGVTSHAEIAGACSACHAAPWENQTMQDRCLVCHQDVPAQMQDLMTPHGRMYAIDPLAACQDCHPEHRGAFASLTEIEGWKYPHELSGYFLQAHQFKANDEPFKCADCHGNDVTHFEAQVCTDCHHQATPAFTETHSLAFGTNCVDCHDGLDRFGSEFTHETYPFKLTGQHAAAECEDCHQGARSLMDFTTAPQTCVACHGNTDPHQGALGPDCESCHTPEGWKPAHFDHNTTTFPLAEAHRSVVCQKCHSNNQYKDTPSDCFSCHKADDLHNGALGTDCASCHQATTWKAIIFDHSTATFPLTGKHTSVACISCHKDLAFKGTPLQCAACHVDFHNGQMGNDCTKCHNTTNWKDVTFDHSLTSYPLIGSHKTVACADCHIGNKYKGTPKNCVACHAAKDIHNGQFGTDCATCHVPTQWKNVNFDHTKTRFPLTGLHATVQCKACHANGTFKGTPHNCFTCHAARDVHAGQFGTACESCHVTSGWKNVVFDHTKTNFPLTGLHANIQCKACHTNGVFKGTPKNCFACHAVKDIHTGQFGTVCESCHNTSGWKNVTFDHAKTAFPLTGLHTNVQCKACHTNGTYKGTPKNCFACHAARDKHNGQFGTACESCHNTSGWKNVTFDHAKTAFPLTGTHTTLQCNACHGNGVYKGTPKDCYSCHAARDKHNGQFGTQCGSCHNTTKWSNVTFDHGKTNFPLMGLHATVQCNSCHGNGVYKGTPTNCYACHAARDKHNGQFGTACEACHNTSGWQNTTFNHNNTSFPLEGKHANLTCSKCHGNGVYQGTPNQCIACHADKDKHNGTNGTDCSICHMPTDWGKTR